MLSFWVQLSEKARERKVPVTRLGRLFNFGGRCIKKEESENVMLYCIVLLWIVFRQS